MLVNLWKIWKRWVISNPASNNSYPHEPERLAHHLEKISRNSVVEWERIRNAS